MNEVNAKEIFKNLYCRLSKKEQSKILTNFYMIESENAKADIDNIYQCINAWDDEDIFYNYCSIIADKCDIIDNHRDVSFSDFIRDEYCVLGISTDPDEIYTDWGHYLEYCEKNN